jgi:hypothetical protein
MSASSFYEDDGAVDQHASLEPPLGNTLLGYHRLYIMIPFSKLNSAMTTLYKTLFLCWYGKALQEHGQKATQQIQSQWGAKSDLSMSVGPFSSPLVFFSKLITLEPSERDVNSDSPSHSTYKS